MAEKCTPSVVFIGKIDDVSTKRYNGNSGGEKEVQIIMLELLNQLDGFERRRDVKVIMATNSIETLHGFSPRQTRKDR